jgi:hypothetical protein
MNSKIDEYIYPDYSAEEDTGYVRFDTMIRIKGDDDKYYLTRVRRKLMNVDQDTDEYIPFTDPRKAYEDVSRQFFRDAYIASILMKVSIDVVFSNGDAVFFLDENQEDEFDRIKEIW